ncbi:hypothetical protein IRZ71_02390 [Flavobacterium sp. ANB]|uniref:hypothetical protein n=1 Tax=unclassified Flavobacterium TaxID=196869 RepID=UPI0012B9DC35|nr:MULTISPECIES: hypothetical protein [unclassified Flavobacterium]MBF4515170.1 hypothetical protein [Flavobacterium sp. ANB]MTD70082.1 hypothetical protein [Flavobacterium sp. LC2016-13]
MKKISIIIFTYFLCFSITCKSQSILADSLEKTALDYLEKNKKKNTADNGSVNTSSDINSTDIKTYSIVIKTYSIPGNKYMICLFGLDVKLCKEEASSVYKIVTIDKHTNLYFKNDFITPITLNEENSHFFLTDDECKIDRESIIHEPIITMLSVDNKFSIVKEFKSMNIQSLTEDILCPTSPSSIDRAYVRKKYGHL